MKLTFYERQQHPGPKLNASLGLMIKSLRLIIHCLSKSLLDLVIAYRSFPNKCTPWFMSTIEPYHCEFASAFLQPFRSNGAFVLAKSI
jgi:hypothetical protein